MTHSSTRLPERKMEVVSVNTSWILKLMNHLGQVKGVPSPIETEQRKKGVTEHKRVDVCSSGANGWTPSAKWSSWNLCKPSWNCCLSSRKGYFSIRFSKCCKHQARGQNHIASQHKKCNRICAGDSNRDAGDFCSFPTWTEFSLYKRDLNSNFIKLLTIQQHCLENICKKGRFQALFLKVYCLNSDC